MEQNAKIARDIFAEVAKVNKDATIVVLSNPVDIITAVIVAMITVQSIIVPETDSRAVWQTCKNIRE